MRLFMKTCCALALILLMLTGIARPVYAQSDGAAATASAVAAAEKHLAQNSLYPWKRALFIGDSIMHGVQAGTPRNWGVETETIPDTVASLLHLQAVKAGIGGSTVSYGKGMGYEPMCNRVSETPTDVDVVFLMGGTSDYLYLSPVGVDVVSYAPLSV